MRQVNLDELEHLIFDALREVRPSIIKQMQDGRHLVASDARHIVSQIIARRFQRLEILSSAPPPPPFRRGGTGTGAPKIDEGEI